MLMVFCSLLVNSCHTKLENICFVNGVDPDQLASEWIHSVFLSITDAAGLVVTMHLNCFSCQVLSQFFSR